MLYTLLLPGKSIARGSHPTRLLSKSRYTPHPTGYQSAVRMSEDFASMSRNEIDIDVPVIESLQALLLLVIAYIAAGKGKKAYMLLST